MPLDPDSVRLFAGFQPVVALDENVFAAPAARTAMIANRSGPEAADRRDRHHLTAPIACVIAAGIKL